MKIFENFLFWSLEINSNFTVPGESELYLGFGTKENESLSP